MYNEIEKKIFKHTNGELTKKALKEQRCCYFPGCSKKTIKSHSFQKRAVLNKICDKSGNVYFTDLPNTYSDYETKLENTVFLHKGHINDASTFFGFCSEHDTEIFKPIEVETELTDNIYEYLFLYAYRGLAYSHVSEKSIETIPSLLTKKKAALEKNPKIENQSIVNYRVTQEIVLAMIKERYNVDKYQVLKQHFEKVLKNGIEEKVIKQFFDIMYIKLPVSMNCLALGAGDLYFGERHEEPPICQGLIPDIDGTGMIYFFICVKGQKHLYHLIFEILPQCTSPIFLSDGRSPLLVIIQNLLLMNLENIVIRPELYNKMKETDEMKNMNRFYTASILNQNIQISNFQGFNLFQNV